jgi:hypothetical protein
MKKIFFGVVILSLFATSCKKDIPNNSVSGEQFSTQTVEQNKATVEDAGIEFVTTMNAMKSIESVDVITNLGDILSSMGAKKAMVAKDSKIISTLENFASAAKGDMKLSDMFKSMTNAKELAGDPQSIKELWDTNVGTYTWNPGLNDWDIVLGGTKVIFLFPSTDVSLTNDAIFTIYDYTGVTIANPIDSVYTGDFPVSLNADLKVGTKTLISMVFGATYNDKGIPSSIASDLTIENYKFEVDLTNNSQIASVNYKFLVDNKVAIDMGASGEGLFTEDNFNDNTHTTTTTHTYTYEYLDYVYNPLTGNWDEVWKTYTDSWDETRTETDFEEIVNSVSAHFQIFSVAIRGDLNVKGLVDEIKIIEADKNMPTYQSDSLYAAKMNEFTNLRLVNVTTNEIMAKAEAYVMNKPMATGFKTSVEFRLTFNDGSPIDAETYINTGFGDFVKEMNIFITGINTDFSTNIETIVY